MNRMPHRSFPKPALRLQERTAQRREALRAWLECCRLVDARDNFRCRCCGRKTIKTLSVCANRLEHHHLHGRNVAPALRYRAQAVISVCLECHGKLTRHELLVKAAMFYRVEGRTYPNADGPLTFI